MPLNIPDSPFERIVIIGAGFAGFTLAKKLARKNFQIVLLDRNNFHQFQPLFYQVGMAGLEPSSICFPLRRSFQSDPNFFVRVAEVQEIQIENKQVITSAGIIRYDKLVLAMGAMTNYYGNEEFEKNSIPLKTVSEALYLRNAILSDLEKSLMIDKETDISPILDVVIVGGGPTGVELAGSLAEMKNFILPKDYPDLDIRRMEINLIQGADRLLPTMSEKASLRALRDLQNMGVRVHLSKRVVGINNGQVRLKDGEVFCSHKVIWAAGVSAVHIPGLNEIDYNKERRILIDSQLKLINHPDLYALGDIAIMSTEKSPYGDPQVASVALQQANWLAKYFLGKKQKPFEYFDKGQLATIGRNKAVVDIGRFHFGGFFAWLTWLFVHIYYLIGVRNKIVVLLNWIWSYIFYDQGLRLLIKPVPRIREN